MSIVKEGTVNKQTYKINNLTKITERNNLKMILQNLRKELLTNDLTKKNRKETSPNDHNQYKKHMTITNIKGNIKGVIIIWQ
ncbi:hypothetical protein VQY16_01220 [Mesomycoplasma ovipneumoniae]